MDLKDTIRKVLPTWNGRLACHHVGYNANGQVHRAIPYNANSPAVIAQQVEMMQDAGIDVVVITWQGTLAAACNTNAMLFAAACADVGMQFALLLDPWCAKLAPTGGSNTNYTANVIASLKASTTQAMLNSSAYLPEKFVLDFNTGANLAVLGTTFPTLKFLAQGSGFSWISIPTITDSVARNASAVANLKSQHANAAMKVASVCFSFNDAGQPLPVGVSTQAQFEAAGGNRNYANSTWGGPSRILDSFAGQFGQQQLATINPATPIIAIITWSDYEEQSSGPFEKVLAEQSGIVWPT
jgi:hypothetical protein